MWGRYVLVSATASVLVTLLISGCQPVAVSLQSNDSAPPRSNPVYQERHIKALWGRLPEPYEGIGNPLPSTSTHIEAGRALYQSRCITCHGVFGDGDGPTAIELTPPPAPLARITTKPFASDAFLNWSISEGGVAFGTAMPAFKHTLSQNQIWQLALYIKLALDYETSSPPLPPAKNSAPDSR